MSFKSEKRVSIAAPRGIPRKTATDFATVEYWMSKVPSSWEMTFMKSKARGAKKTIWRIELRATRMAQYSLSPPAKPVHIRTWVLFSSVFLKLTRGGEVPLRYIVRDRRGLVLLSRRAYPGEMPMRDQAGEVLLLLLLGKRMEDLPSPKEQRSNSQRH